MTKFCKTYISERSEEELRKRLEELTKRKDLGPGLEQEKKRIEQELAWKFST